MSLMNTESEIVVSWEEVERLPMRKRNVSLSTLYLLMESLGFDSQQLLEALVEQALFAPRRKHGA